MVLTSGPVTYERFSVTGTVYVLTGTHPLYVNEDQRIMAIRASVGGAPQGQSIVVDVLRNGVSLFASTPGNRPTIAPGQLTALSGALDDDKLTPGDHLTCNVLQVGSTQPGVGLTVDIELQRP